MKRNLYILWNFTFLTLTLLASGKALERGDIITTVGMLLLSFATTAYIFVCVNTK